MTKGFTRRTGLLGATALGALAMTGTGAGAQALKGGRLRVALLADVNNYDPQSFLAVNFPLFKNLYDSLIEYDADGRAVPSLAESWTIAPGNTGVSMTLRSDVKFHSGGAFDANAVAATLRKGADPKTGKNVFPTMSVVKDWVVTGPHAMTINFNTPVPDRQITDLLQFISVIDPQGIDTVETKPAGSGAYTLAERVLGQRIRLAANPNYWRKGEPLCSEVVFTVFSDNDAAAAALESGAVDLIYGANGRAGVRLRNAGYTLVQGPGPLIQTLRLKTTVGPLRNAKFRQALNYLVDRRAILRVGYSGLGEVTALPFTPSSPAFDASYNTKYAFDIEKGRALLKESGLTPQEMSAWKLLVNGSDQDAINISQLVQSTLARVGVDIQLEIKQGAEWQEALIGGKFDATFGGIGNAQKFPTRVTNNSIYRISNNPVLGEPHPHPAYVAAVERVNKTFGSGADVKAAYDNLNKEILEASFAIPTNTFDVALIVAGKNVAGFTSEIDNMLVARTIGFR